MWLNQLDIQLCLLTENLCGKNSTTVLQSSTYEDRKETLATDGDLRTNYRYCAHTDVNQTVAWFQVDLGKPYSISNVTLYYRKDGKTLPPPLFLKILLLPVFVLIKQFQTTLTKIAV